MSGAVSVGEAMQTLGPVDSGRIKRLLEGGIKIPPQPRVLEELRQQTMRKQFDVRVLSRIIGQDPGIAAMLFKVVTNAAYRQHQPFDSIEQILHAVGVRQTFNLVQAISMINLGGVKKHQLVYEAFWARSKAIAQIAMLVADERVSVCNIFPDQAYIAAIFHDCGVLLQLQRFPTYCAEMRLEEPGRWVHLADEDRKFNADHCVVGYIVARHWCLPEFICDAIRFHHDVAQLENHSARTMVAILQLASELYYREQRVPNPEWELVKHEVLPELGMDEDALLEFADIVMERYHIEASTA